MNKLTNKLTRFLNVNVYDARRKVYLQSIFLIDTCRISIYISQ